MIPGFGRSPGGGNGSPLQEDLLEGEMTTHSSILARRMLWTEEPGRHSSWRHKESDMTEHLSNPYHSLSLIGVWGFINL